jgi:hypothetical protein
MEDEMSDPYVEKDYYSILGVVETASQEEIERLYKRLAKQHHPDRGGNMEEMKAINEAYRVLGNVEIRRTYDLRFHSSDDVLHAVTPPLVPPSALLPDTVYGRLVGALFFLLAGLLFLFLVRIYYIRFMWPILLVAVFVVIFGVWKVHTAIGSARKRLAPSDRARPFAWFHELVFWSIACGAAYGIYILISAI